MDSATENSDVSDTEGGGGRNYPNDLFDDERSGDEERPAQGRNDDNSDKDDENKDKDKDENKKTVKPKKVAVRKPILLNEDMLCSEKGLPKLHELFKSFEFGSKGHEKHDLDRILHKLEHWIHVLHPKHPFDQTLERIEFLGLKKKSVKTMIKKIRLGMTMNGPNVFAEDVDEDEGDNNHKEREESDGDKENEEDNYISKKNPIQDLSDEEYPDLNDLVPVQKSTILSNAVEDMEFDYPDLSELESDKFTKISANVNPNPFEDDDEFPDISEIELIENSILGNQMTATAKAGGNEDMDKNVEELNLLPAQNVDTDTIDENDFNQELDKPPEEKPIADMTTINLGFNLNNTPIDEEQDESEVEMATS